MESLNSIISSMDPFFVLLFGLAAIVLISCLQAVRLAFQPRLRTIPGPFIARFTKFYRAFNIAKGDSPQFYLRLHDQYGPIVRAAPKMVSISDPTAVPIIYGVNNKYLKTHFYDTMTPYFKDAPMPSMFTNKDPADHQAFKKPVSHMFSMTAMKALEPFADECSSIFLEAMKDLEGQAVDLGVWLQW